MLTVPSSTDLINGMFWSGRSAEVWIKSMLEPAGISINDVLITGAMRCRGPKTPVGPILDNAVKVCRQYDDQLKIFGPNLAIATYSLADTRKVLALSRLVIADFKKAVRMSDRGFKPVVLMGDAPSKLIFPYMTGLRHWRGQYTELEGWPF
jgi:hypothetical protein